MTQESAEAFYDKLERHIDYFRKEFDLTYFELVGALTHMAHTLSSEAEALDEESTEYEDEDEAYGTGFDEGFQEGFKTCQEGGNDNLDRDVRAGHKEVLEEGQGSPDRFDAGHRTGYEYGLEEGRDKGYNEGYKDGLQEGQDKEGQDKEVQDKGTSDSNRVDEGKEGSD